MFNKIVAMSSLTVPDPIYHDSLPDLDWDSVLHGSSAGVSFGNQAFGDQTFMNQAFGASNSYMHETQMGEPWITASSSSHDQCMGMPIVPELSASMSVNDRNPFHVMGEASVRPVQRPAPRPVQRPVPRPVQRAVLRPVQRPRPVPDPKVTVKKDMVKAILSDKRIRHIKFLNHQYYGIAFLKATMESSKGRSALLADEMGLGKTLTAIATAVHMGHKNILVVCPANLEGQWASQITKWLQSPDKKERLIDFSVDSKSKPEDIASGYESNTKETVRFSIISQTRFAKLNDAVLSRLSKSLHMMMFDEIHKYSGGKKTKSTIRKISYPGVEYVSSSCTSKVCKIFISGTPIRTNVKTEIQSYSHLMGVFYPNLFQHYILRRNIDCLEGNKGVLSGMGKALPPFERHSHSFNFSSKAATIYDLVKLSLNKFRRGRLTFSTSHIMRRLSVSLSSVDPDQLKKIETLVSNTHTYEGLQTLLDKIENIEQKRDEDSCYICLETVERQPKGVVEEGKEHVYLDPCLHELHQECAKVVLETKPTCGICRVNVLGFKTKDQVQSLLRETVKVERVPQKGGEPVPPKFEFIKALLERGPHQKCIIGSPYRQSLAALSNYLESQKISCCNLSVIPDKDAAIAGFKEPKGARVLLLTEQSAAGLDLSIASMAIMLSPFTSNSNLSQFWARIHRIGQEAEKVDMYALITKGSIEEKIYERLIANSKTIKDFYDSVDVSPEDFQNALQDVLASEMIQPVENVRSGGATRAEGMGSGTAGSRELVAVPGYVNKVPAGKRRRT